MGIDMTKQEAYKDFRKFTLPMVIDHEQKNGGGIDYPKRREAWGIFIDSYVRNGLITEKQYDSWVYPKECGD